MIDNRFKDIRIPEIIKTIDITNSRTQSQFVDVLLTENNDLIYTTMNTTHTITSLASIPNIHFDRIAFNYKQILEINEELESNEYAMNLPTVQRNIWNTYQFYMNECAVKPLVAHEDNLQDKEDFKPYIKMKSGDPLVYYKIIGNELYSQYLMPVFNGFPNLGTGDKLSVTIYDQLDGHLIFKHDIFKKKLNKNIQIYFRTLKLI
jgi:hypothetical protein